MVKDCSCTLTDQNCNHLLYPKKAEETMDYNMPSRLFDEVEGLMAPSKNTKVLGDRGKFKSNLEDDSRMLAANRPAMRKFESLSLNGDRLTELTIGGFSVDLEKVATKAREVLPMPASKLPRIFLDGDLNFYHHFFQGMALLMGGKNLETIVESEIYFEDSTTIIMSLIESILISGYEKSDSELVILVKKVLTATFEFEEHSRSRGDNGILRIASNLWGFQYIEQGMQCRESDLKMWLSMCYTHYKTLWFNTFKSTGVPAFAVRGVQVRRSSTSSRSTLDSIKEIEQTDPVDVSYLLEQSKHRPRRKSRSVTSTSRGAKSKYDSAIVKWIGSTNN